MLDNLKKSINTAFKEVTRLNGITLHEAKVMDDYGDDNKRLEAKCLDKDQYWTEIPDEIIEDAYDCLPFFDQISYKYYLPAYMIWVLNNFKKKESNVADFLLYSLSYKTIKDKISEFNKEQLQVVYDFLNYLSNNHDAILDLDEVALKESMKRLESIIQKSV